MQKTQSEGVTLCDNYRIPGDRCLYNSEQMEAHGRGPEGPHAGVREAALTKLVRLAGYLRLEAAKQR
jgi:hypothetical protein